MKKLLYLLLLVGCASSNDPVPQPIVSDLKPDKNLLIIGDSISMGYTPYLQKDLAPYYNVTHVTDAPAPIDDGLMENAQGTTHTLANVDRWLSQVSHQDVIVWNNGLWNARNPLTDPYAPGNATDLPTYQSELIQIAIKLKATGARVIFFTTTDIPATGSTFIPGRDLDENSIAWNVLSPLGIEVYDLNALARSNPKLHLSNDPIHFNTQGYSLFAEFIADMVRTNYQYSN